MTFQDRVDAGKQLAEKLLKYKNNSEVVVLGLPRGGLPVAYEVAKALNAPLDLIVSRKIHFPGAEEVAIGAITATASCKYDPKSDDPRCVYDEDIIKKYNIEKEYIEKDIANEYKEAQRRLNLYRGQRPPLDLTGKIAVVIDDGIATGATMLAAIGEAKMLGAKKTVVAVPVIPADNVKKFEKAVDQFIYLDAPYMFWGVGGSYKNFGQTEDEEVIKIMEESKKTGSKN